MGGAAKGGISLYARGLVDGVVGGVGVEFLGKVIVFALHLISEVVDAVVDIRIYIVEPGIHIAEARIHRRVQVA